ncbi:RIS1-like protein [Fusarium heterosporum]|uniref:RIS1-like protein n=1 Tax=Fusarium heterosporum TaxID=42747 RepID=A0A8H5TH43_FUSHE|nr:RIS1-like protein [Fusarium heterosporum]
MNTTPVLSHSDTGTHQAGPVKKEESLEADCAIMPISKCPEVKMEDSKEVNHLENNEEPIAVDYKLSIKGTASVTKPLRLPSPANKPAHLTQVKQEEFEGVNDLKLGKGYQANCKMTAEKFMEEIFVGVGSRDEDDADQDYEEDEDSDFDPDDSPDSDCSDDSEAQEKREKLKLIASMSAEKKLETLENDRNRLAYKQLKGNKLDSDESKALKKLEKMISKVESDLANCSKPKEALPKTAREYWQRQLRSEMEEEERKRKRDEEEELSRKAQKTSNKTKPGGVAQPPGLAMATSLLISNSAEADESGSGVPAMKEIKANTRAGQMKQVRANIPEGSDAAKVKEQNRGIMDAVKSFGNRKVRARDGLWLLAGMKTPLKHYQLIGACWMTRREAMDLDPAGGILADEMGLGKTITALATIVGHSPEKQDKREFCLATLIIADRPQSAEREWMAQIKQHVGEKIADKCIIYSKSVGQSNTWWGNRKVVITHLDELRAQYLSKRETKQLRGEWAGDEAGFQRALYDKLGPLFQINWYRVILDEAQGIKNHTSSGKRTCSLAIEGQVPLSTDWHSTVEQVRSMPRFKARYIHSAQAAQNFEAMASVVMLRRKQTEQFLGRSMVPLPKSHRTDVWVTLTSWEKIMNQVVDTTYQEKLQGEQDSDPESDANEEQHDDQDNADKTDDAGDSDAESEADFEKDGEVDSKVPNEYRVQNTRCLRLVQLTSNPLNLEKFFRENDRESEVKSALGRFKAEITQESVSTDRKALEEALGSAYLSGLNELEEATKNTFGGVEDMAMLLALVDNEQSIKGVTCGLCHKKTPPEIPVRNLNCEHIYCELCLTLGPDNKKKRGGRPLLVSPAHITSVRADQKLTTVDTTKCRHVDCSAKLAKGEYIKTPGSIDAAVKAIKGFKESGRDSIGTRWHGCPDEVVSFFRAASGREEIGYGPVKMPLGSKLKATMAVVLSWQREAPDDKIILYIQWTRTAKTLGCILESMGIGFVYYNRMATKKQKNRALDEFTHDPKIKILVSSMKCGGQSLNLQMANRCIIVDEWWNKAVEEQAFRRVFRTGQTKETHLVRIMAKDTIDERIIMLQDIKEKMIAAALQDNELQPHFTGQLQLRVLFSHKDAESLEREMEEEMRGTKKMKQK